MQKSLKLSLLALAATTLVACGGADDTENGAQASITNPNYNTPDPLVQAEAKPAVQSVAVFGSQVTTGGATFGDNIAYVYRENVKGLIEGGTPSNLSSSYDAIYGLQKGSIYSSIQRDGGLTVLTDLEAKIEALPINDEPVLDKTALQEQFRNLDRKAEDYQQKRSAILNQIKKASSGVVTLTSNEKQQALALMAQAKQLANTSSLALIPNIAEHPNTYPGYKEEVAIGCNDNTATSYKEAVFCQLVEAAVKLYQANKLVIDANAENLNPNNPLTDELVAELKMMMTQIDLVNQQLEINRFLVASVNSIATVLLRQEQKMPVSASKPGAKEKFIADGLEKLAQQLENSEKLFGNETKRGNLALVRGLRSDVWSSLDSYIANYETIKFGD